MQTASALERSSPEIKYEISDTESVPNCAVSDAPCEAEAQCAELCKAGKVWGVGTEDMDALTFGTTVLIRHLTFSEAKKMPIKEFHLDVVLRDLGLNQQEFIDLCILLGCDYCSSIKGIGPKKAIDLIQKHRSIDAILKNIDQKKYPPPEDWPFEQARELFVHPQVESDPEKLDFKWAEPDIDGLIEYMVKDKGFAEDRIRKGAEKLKKSRQGGTQGRIDSFFTITPSNNTPKRKSENKKPNDNKKGNSAAKKARKIPK